VTRRLSDFLVFSNFSESFLLFLFNLWPFTGDLGFDEKSLNSTSFEAMFDAP
jgi:hypothetical protein